MQLIAVLFDLDNTLILFDEPVFFENYSRKLYLAFRDLMTPEEFSRKLIQSTQMMIQNNGEQTNAEFFINAFADGMSEQRAELWQRFESFYANEFDQFQPLMRPVPGVRDLLLKLLAKRLKLVIASNPMFPMNVQQKRLNWAGIDDLNYDLITSAENTAFVKPRLEYYQHICKTLKVQPENCLMVGNDGFNDMIAAKIGMKTYLTTDSQHLSIELSRELASGMKMEMPTPDFKGSVTELWPVIEMML
ncbi:MAG: HAD family hydrolase [candidate division KSB1 bacterium]|nr:HAD family hydrolase [candidate division KSB1 bacterium]